MQGSGGCGAGQGRAETMDLNTLGVFKLLNKKMDWLNQRHEVLAQNVANVDTPNYKSSDLTPFTFKSALGEAHRLAPVLTNPGHQLPPGYTDEVGEAKKDKTPYETKPDGNSVVVEDQMLKMSQSGQDYTMITNLYKKNLRLLKLAIRSGGS